MKVALVGYGRMGVELEAVLKTRGHEIIRRVDALGNGDVTVLDSAALEGAEGIIEFALAEGMLERIAIYSAARLPVVIGTTGWESLADKAREIFEAGGNAGGKTENGTKTAAGAKPGGTPGAALLRGSNFSLGAHLFFRLTAFAATLINKADEYDAALVEYHHNKKADYPSGTAITAAEGVLASLDRKTHILKDLPDGPVPREALQVASLRVGAVPGIHEMRMDSPADFLTIRHEARGRGGFALGAVRGLEWLRNKQGWHEAEEFIDDLLI
ncbi:MAG: 4-hydroxy-tetrahydrodipicolinate reductase [Spirochaetaceae bacterium]|nr:4-hydroxy-tetrahydrodipicolinate reductase [Spirochaetaceae bacterium]